MEYSLLLDKKRKYISFWLCIAFSVFVIHFLFIRMGVFGLMGIGTILFFLLITPLLYNKYKLFLVCWLFIIPCFDSFTALSIAGTYPQVYLATGLTIPFALLLINRELDSVLKKYPFVLSLILFLIITFLNFFRPGSHFGSITEVLKIFIQVFIIFCVYSYSKTVSSNDLYKFMGWVREFMTANALFAIFQRITGIGVTVIEGIPRVSGLLGHPNVLAFLMVLYIPFAIYNLLKTSDKKTKFLWTISILAGSLALVLTICKSVIFIFLVQLFILVFFVNIKNKIKIISSLIASFVLFVVLNYALDLQIIQLIVDRINNSASMDFRYRVWGYLMSDINIANIWFGHGIDTAQRHILTISGDNLMAHNAYLQLLYELGLVGVILFLIPFLFYLFKFTYLLLKAKSVERIYYVLPLLIIIAILINMSTDNSVFMRTPMTFVWIFLIGFYNELCLNEKATNIK